MKTLLILTIATALFAAEVPIACNLKALTADQRQEMARLADHAVKAVADSKELPDGYSFRLNLPLSDVANWVDLWRRCCPFYEFAIDVHGADGTIWLTLRGRPGVKEYFPIDAPRLAATLRK